MEDEKIISLFFQRSEQAIRELADKYGGACHRLSYRIVNDRQDAENVSATPTWACGTLFPRHRPIRCSAIF